MEKQKIIDAEFEKYWEHMKPHIGEISDIKELCRAFFNQGHISNIPVGDELTEQEFEDFCFMNFVKECIENPENMPKPAPQSDYVVVTAPCKERDKCIAFPDRCKDAGCDDIGVCKRLINISKLCGVDNAVVVNKDKLMTSDEMELLANVLTSVNA